MALDRIPSQGGGMDMQIRNVNGNILKKFRCMGEALLIDTNSLPLYTRILPQFTQIHQEKTTKQMAPPEANFLPTMDRT